jgi:hypothetical protein
MDRYIGIDVRAASCTNAVVDNGALARWVDCRRQAFRFAECLHRRGWPHHRARPTQYVSKHEPFVATLRYSGRVLRARFRARYRPVRH